MTSSQTPIVADREFRTYELAEVELRERAKLLESLIYPRPIAWISTISTDGRPNLAPFSFFNMFSPAPPTIVVAPGTRPVAPPTPDGPPPRCEDKDTLANIRASGEFAVSLISEDLLEQANLSSVDVGPEEDEWELVGVTPRRSVDIAAPTVAESPVSFECRVQQVVDLDHHRGARTNALVVARVTMAHVAADVLDEEGRGDPLALRLVGRIGGPRYSRTTDYIELARPAV